MTFQRCLQESFGFDGTSQQQLGFLTDQLIDLAADVLETWEPHNRLSAGHLHWLTGNNFRTLVHGVSLALA